MSRLAHERFYPIETTFGTAPSFAAGLLAGVSWLFAPLQASAGALFRLQPLGRPGRDLNGQANPHRGGADVPDLPHCPYRPDGLDQSCAGIAHLGAPPARCPSLTSPSVARPSGSIR